MTQAGTLEALRLELEQDLEVPEGAIAPRISIILPTFNCSEAITSTLKSIESQQYSNLEVIVVDASSTDRTLDAVKEFRAHPLRVHSVTTFHLYSMLNKGINLASGEYINFIFPGHFFLSPHTLNMVAAGVRRQDNPDLLYFGSIIREEITEPRPFFRPFSEKSLSQGQLPTCLEACWFHVSYLKGVGGFALEFELRAFLDLLCRLQKFPDFRVAGMSRVITDYERPRLSYRNIWLHFSETRKVVRQHYGFWAMWLFLLRQKDGTRALRCWWQGARLALLGK